MTDKPDTEALLQPEEGEEVSDDSSSVTSDPSDKLTPDHPRFKEVYSDLKEEKQKNKDLLDRVERLEEQARQRMVATGNDEYTPEELQALEKIDKDFRRRGYVTQEQLEERDRVSQRKLEYDRLSSKYDGDNGYPKFIPDEVETYAKRNGFGGNYEAAYKDMHFDTILNLEAKKRSDRPRVPGSEIPTGGQVEIPETDLTPEQIAKMSPQDYEKYREKIKMGMKQMARTS